ncbi:MAG: helix-turn-helix transcriptional regulator [Candidatus Tectomicrobia bacterium]|nr:helix-turn-helix transcriptional regulator [Candidatus Tectomicrobia bacterium]
MSTTPYLTTREVAELLRIHEKQVYALIKAGAIPCTRVTGKWLFPRRLVDEWLVTSSARRGAPPPTAARQTLLIAGSDDLLLSSLPSLLRRQAPGFILGWACLGSIGGLYALRDGAVHVAGCHLDAAAAGDIPLEGGSGDRGPSQPARRSLPGQQAAPGTVSGTQDYARRLLAGEATLAVTFAERCQGWIVARGNPKRIARVADLVRREVRLVNRQEGSGTRLLLERCLREAGLERRRLRGAEREVSTHLEVAMAVARGEADVALGTEAAAAALRLDFVPLARERYQLIMQRRTLELPSVQALLEVLRSSAFARLARSLPGYSAQAAGSVCWENPGEA